MEVVDSRADLNAYAKVGGAAGCAAPAEPAPAPSGRSSLPIATTGGCCGSGSTTSAVHSGLSDLLRRYDINEYAASVKVYAVKPR